MNAVQPLHAVASPALPDGQTVLSVRHWDDRLFSFRVSRPAGFRFRSGEFVMIGLPGENGKPLLRAYSIASPFWDEELEFYSIKVPDGPLTSRLQKIAVGEFLLGENADIEGVAVAAVGFVLGVLVGQFADAVTAVGLGNETVEGGAIGRETLWSVHMQVTSAFVEFELHFAGWGDFDIACDKRWGIRSGGDAVPGMRFEHGREQLSEGAGFVIHSQVHILVTGTLEDSRNWCSL